MKLYSISGGNYMRLPLQYITAERPMYSSLPRMREGDIFWLSDYHILGYRGLVQKSDTYFCIDDDSSKQSVELCGLLFTNTKKSFFLEVYTMDILQTHFPYRGRYVFTNETLKIEEVGECVNKEIDSGYWCDALYVQPNIGELEDFMKSNEKFSTISQPSNRCGECGMIYPHINPVSDFVCRPCRDIRSAWS